MADDDATPPLIIVDPDPASRNFGEDLEDDLECQVIAMDSMDFSIEGSEEIAVAQAFIICWDLGFRSGADLLEMIRGNESLQGRIVLIATPEPTPSLVRTLFALGADGICMQPYDAEEIQSRLTAITEHRAARAAA